jgi:hypothetical protein
VALEFSFSEAFWFAWTRVLDLNEDQKVWSGRVLGSLFSILGLIIVGGAFITLAEEAANRTVEKLLRGRVPADFSGLNVIAGKHVSKIRAFLNALPDNEQAEKILIITPNQESLALARKLSVNAISEKSDAKKTSDDKSPALATKKDRHIMLGVAQLWEDTPKNYKFHDAHRIILLDDYGNNTGDILKIINKIYDSIKERTKGLRPLEIYAEVNDRDMANTLRLTVQEIDHKCSDINLHILNQADKSARLALKHYPLDCIPIPPDSKYRIHLIIEGWTAFAQALFWQALRVAHFPVKPTRITVYHPDAQKIESEVYEAAPGLKEAWCQEQLVKIKFEQKLIPLSLNSDDNDLITLAICSTDSDRVFVNALKFKMSKFPGLQQIYLELPNNSGYRDVINKMALQPKAEDKPVRMVATGLSEESIDLEEKLDEVAEKIHSHYRKKYGDVEWSKLDETKRAWNRSPADHIDVKKRVIAAMIKKVGDDQEKENERLKDVIKRLAGNPENQDSSLVEFINILSRIEHDRWCAEKYADGWTFAPGQKDNALRKNPCLIPYDDLPEKPVNEKLKDWETMKIILEHINK